MRIFVLVVLCSTIVLNSACSPEQKKTQASAVSVRLQLKWLHSAQFAGFYVAKEQGYFTEEGLDVVLLEGGPSVDQVEKLNTGAADIALVPAESLFLKNNPLDRMQAIAVIYQHSPLVFAVKADSEITRPEDFTGKTIGVGELDAGGFLEGIIQYNALMKHRNIDTSTNRIAPYDWNFDGFINGSVDITPTYMTSGAIKLKHMGIDVHMIWPGDYGIDYYADTLVAKQSYIEEHPDVIERFLKAVLRGWKDAVADTDLAVKTTLAYAQVQDESLQQDIMDTQTPLVHSGNVPIGWMKHDAWFVMYNTLQAQNLIQEPLEDISTIYNMAALEKIYPEQSSKAASD